ncbi:MAG: hypothetical protein ABI882_10585 [Acidobacteriota bacterium]
MIERGPDDIAEPVSSSLTSTSSRYTTLTAICLAVGSGLVYLFSNPKPNAHFDYTFRTAVALLHGKLGLSEQPPSWLNEMVPLGGWYYSVFPLGAVLSVLPVALLKVVHVIDEFPAALVVAIIAGTTTLFFFLLTAKYQFTLSKRIVLALFPVFGSWMWANLAFAGAWQISLGFAVLGQVGALYFLLIRSNPILAGVFFALAYGNRTEVIVVWPIMLYLLLRDQVSSWSEIKLHLPKIAKFCAAPVLLGIATLLYNQARFGSPFDFGYSRIPVIQSEDWFKNGLFTLRAIPANAWQMLFETWKQVPGGYPYLTPKGFGGSILLSSPFLFLVFTRSVRDRGLKMAAWVAVILLTLVLWTHANTGGWQFSYRYAMILLPWLLLLVMEVGPARLRRIEIILFAISVAINAWGTYLFLWTNYVTP